MSMKAIKNHLHDFHRYAKSESGWPGIDYTFTKLITLHCRYHNQTNRNFDPSLVQPVVFHTHGLKKWERECL